MRALRAMVTGHVQGVGFRYSTTDEARRLGVAGWVRNTPEGSVELHLEGEDAAVADLIEWLHHGPAGARVDEVRTEDVAPTGDAGFRTTR